jgi:hypothetical protein
MLSDSALNVWTSEKLAGAQGTSAWYDIEAMAIARRSLEVVTLFAWACILGKSNAELLCMQLYWIIRGALP